MANKLLRVQKLVYIPAVLPVAARAAFCVSHSVDTAVSWGGSGWAFSSSRPTGSRSGSARQPEASFIPSSQNAGDGEYGSGLYAQTYYSQVPTGSAVSYSPGRPGVTASTTCYPAVVGRAGSPARYDYVDNFGWSAGARSISAIPASGYIRGVLPDSPAGVQLGFCRRQFNHTYSEMTHSLVARRDAYTVVENGSTVFGPAPLPAGSTVEVRRVGGLVSYLVNDEEAYRSATPSVGEVYGAAMLYNVSDFVDSPSIGSLQSPATFAATLPPIQIAAAETADYAVALLRMAPIQFQAVAIAPDVVRFSATLPAMIAAIAPTTDVQWVDVDMPRVRFAGTLAAAEEMITNFIGLLPPPILSATALQGAAIQFSAELRVASAIATEPYNFVQTTFPYRLRTITSEPYMPAGVIDGSDAAILRDWGVLESAILLLAYDSLGIDESAGLVIVLDLATEERLEYADAASVGQIVELVATETVAVASNTGAARKQAIQYAVNWITGALTEYENFDFHGFATCGGDTFAWRPDGLYRLGADTDAGDLISGLISYGNTDFDTTYAKRAAVAYIGVRTDGQCYLRVTTNGSTRVYKTHGTSDVRKAKLAQGVLARYWGVTLELVDASFATVDSVEVELQTTDRRVFGRRG